MLLKHNKNKLILNASKVFLTCKIYKTKSKHRNRFSVDPAAKCYLKVGTYVHMLENLIPLRYILLHSKKHMTHT